MTEFGDSRLPLRFWSNATPSESGCWEWKGRRDTWGYSKYRAAEGERGGHRVAYLTLVGPIPPGLHLDHLCRNTLCVNPAHLEPVTPRENVMRSNGLTANYARRTHCKHGHEFTPENTAVTGNRRRCRACIADQSARRRK